MHNLTILAATALVMTAALAPPAQALVDPIVVKFPDGITAKLAFPGSVGDLVLVPDSSGDVTVQVTIFRNVGGAWSQVAQGATLRVFSSAPEVDLVSTYFTSSATGPTTLSFPASALAGAGFYDVFVTFNIPTYTTSHHNVVKNALIDQELYNTADYLDYNLNHRPLLLEAPAVPALPLPA